MTTRCGGPFVVVAADDVYVATAELNFLSFFAKNAVRYTTAAWLGRSVLHVFSYGYMCLSLFSAKSAVLYTTAAWLGASVTAASAHGTSVSADFAILRPQTLGSASKA